MDANTILQNFEPDKRHSLAILQDFQRNFSYISEKDLHLISEYLGIPLSTLFSLATFYKSLSLEKKGAFVIKVCDGTACHIRGSVAIIDEIKNALKINEFETTPDGLFTLEVLNCVGSCAMAPVVICNEDYYGNAKKGAGRNIIDKCKEAAHDE